jgi:excisionase family DNA binding protein
VANLPGPPALGDRWLSVDEIAAYLGVKRDTVYKWIGRTNMPAHKVGRLWKFRKYEVDEWVYSKDDQSSRQEKHGHVKQHQEKQAGPERG